MKGKVDRKKADAFADAIAKTSWVLSSITSDAYEHEVVDIVRYRQAREHVSTDDKADVRHGHAGRKHGRKGSSGGNIQNVTDFPKLSTKDQWGSSKMEQIREEASGSDGDESDTDKNNDPPLRYAYEVSIGVAVALENEAHSVHLKCGVPDVRAAISPVRAKSQKGGKRGKKGKGIRGRRGQPQRRSIRGNTMTTLLEFLSIYDRVRRAPAAPHLMVRLRLRLGCWWDR